jgi:hypothetical protein
MAIDMKPTQVSARLTSSSQQRNADSDSCFP